MSNKLLPYQALTIDNTNLKNDGYRFNEGLLSQLKQFKNSGLQIVFTEIVHKEAIKHLGDTIQEAQNKVSQGIKAAKKHLNISTEELDNLKELAKIDVDPHVIAEDRLNHFYEQTGAIILLAKDHVDCARLTEMYFKPQPPFEGSKNKKNEFPDAMALLTLESWGTKNNKDMLAISDDNGWEKFSDDFGTITTVKKLADAFELIIPQHKNIELVKNLREKISTEATVDIFEQIEGALSDSLDGIDVDIEADSYLFYELDENTATYCGHSFAEDRNGNLEVTVVSANDNEIVLRFAAKVEYSVTASFDFSVYDSVDKDNIYMGGTEITKDDSYYTEILVHIFGELTENLKDMKYDVSHIEITVTPNSIDFGHIEPYYDENPEDHYF